MMNGMGRLVFLWSLGISLLAGRAVAQTRMILEGERDALYAQGSLLSASLDGSLPTLPAIKALPGATKDPWKLDTPGKNPKTDPFEGESSSGGRIQGVAPERGDTRVHWANAFWESLYYTGLMHTFNLATEAGTRDTLNGHWFQHYRSSVSELRGWSDSDTFMAPYVGHPIEGSVFGFIFRQNDPKYRTVQLGDGRDYYISLLRSMAYGAVWHTQWKIGPISEASIGNVMLHASPGFITLVGTPTLGALTMLAEDAADRHLIMGLENRTSNRAAIILARSFLNPGRTMANLTAFRVPWARETRLNLFGENYELRKELLREYKEEGGEKPFEFVKRTPLTGVEFNKPYPREAPIELEAFPVYESFLGGGSCVGGGGQGAARVNPKLQIVAEVNGCLVMHMSQSNQSGDSLFYGVGPRWTPRAAEKFSPFAQVLIGGRRVTHETDDGTLRAQLLKEWKDGNGTLTHYPTRFDWSTEKQANGFSVAAASGLDVVLTRAFAWRVVSVEYTHSWLPDVDMIRAQEGIKVTTGGVLRIGTW